MLKQVIVPVCHFWWCWCSLLMEVLTHSGCDYPSFVWPCGLYLNLYQLYELQHIRVLTYPLTQVVIFHFLFCLLDFILIFTNYMNHNLILDHIFTNYMNYLNTPLLTILMSHSLTIVWILYNSLRLWLSFFWRSFCSARRSSSDSGSS